MTLNYSRRDFWIWIALFVSISIISVTVVFARPVFATGGQCGQYLDQSRKLQASDPARAAQLKQQWKTCTESKCKAVSNACPKGPAGGDDADCKAFCQETTTKEGKLTSCCAGGAQETQSCPKKIGINCNAQPTKPQGGEPPKPPEKKDEKPPEGKPPELPKPPGGEKKPSTPPQPNSANCDVSGAFGGGKEAVDANGKPCPKTTQTSDNQGTSETTRTAADELKSLGDSLNSDKSAESGKSADSANSGNSADSATNKDSGSKDKAKEGFGSQLAAYFSKMGKSLSNVLSPTADSGGAGATKVTTNSGLPVTEDSSTMHSNSTFNVPTGIQNIQVPDSFFVQVNKAINDLILNFASTLGIH